MKTIFKLKETPYNFITYMTNEQAEKAYHEGKLPFETFRGTGSYTVPCGFYSTKLTFEQWLKRYEITLIDSEEI